MNTDLKGWITLVTIPTDCETSVGMAIDAGFKSHIPRNDASAAFTKSVIATKAKFDTGETRNPPKHHRYPCPAGYIKVAIVRPRMSHGEYWSEDFCVAVYEKKVSRVYVEAKNRTEEVEAFEIELRAEFNRQLREEILNHDQIRNTFNSAVHSCRPISLRPSGGVYWVDNDFSDDLKRITEFFSSVGATVSLIPSFDNAETNQVVSSQLESSVISQYVSFVEKFDREIKTGMSEKVYQNRMSEMQKLIKEIGYHTELLSEKAKEFQTKAEVATRVLNNRYKIAEKKAVPYSLSDEIEKMISGVEEGEVDLIPIEKSIDEAEESEEKKSMWDEII